MTHVGGAVSPLSGATHVKMQIKYDKLYIMTLMTRAKQVSVYRSLCLLVFCLIGTCLMGSSFAWKVRWSMPERNWQDRVVGRSFISANPYPISDNNWKDFQFPLLLYYYVYKSLNTHISKKIVLDTRARQEFNLVQAYCLLFSTIHSQEKILDFCLHE